MNHFRNHFRKVRTSLHKDRSGMRHLNKDESARKNRYRSRGQGGFTLVEMLVVMGVFIFVIMIAGDSFIKIMKFSNLLSRRAESNIEGVIGLEMFRHDLNQAGFGLPWSFSGSNKPQYSEAGASPANIYNDTPSGIPRAFVAGNNLTVNNVNDSDYLVLKGTSLATTATSQRWTYVNYSSAGSLKPRVWSSGNLADGDRVIVLRRQFTESGSMNQLIYDNTKPNEFFTTYSKDGFTTSQQAFAPSIPQETFFLYGVTRDQDPKRPFNRSDYFVSRPPGIPQYCAPKTGVLYKTTLNHNDTGDLFYLPIMDCVANMQVVFGWDINEDGAIDTLSDADGTTVSGSGVSSTDIRNTMNDAGHIRNRLKLVKVYLMVQDGRRDPTFTNNNTITVGDSAEKSLTKEYDVAALTSKEWLHYRWKIYRIVVNPKNLRVK